MEYKEWGVGDWVYYNDEPAVVVQVDTDDCVFPLEIEYERDGQREWVEENYVTERFEEAKPMAYNKDTLQLELGEYEITLAEIAAQMTEGQRVHFANHLYKHYGVGAQKLLQKDTELPRQFIIDGELYEKR